MTAALPKMPYFAFRGLMLASHMLLQSILIDSRFLIAGARLHAFAADISWLLARVRQHIERRAAPSCAQYAEKPRQTRHFYFSSLAHELNEMVREFDAFYFTTFLITSRCEPQRATGVR